MIRRVAAALAVVLVVGAAALSLGAKSDDGGSKTYNLLFDNAFWCRSCGAIWSERAGRCPRCGAML